MTSVEGPAGEEDLSNGGEVIQTIKKGPDSTLVHSVGNHE